MAVLENDKLQKFEDQSIRTAWDEEQEEWYFSVVDVVNALTEQKTPRGASNYWAKLKQRLKAEGANELLTNCQQLLSTHNQLYEKSVHSLTTKHRHATNRKA